MNKILSYRDLEEKHTSALAFLEANNLFEPYATLVCHIDSELAHEVCPELKELEAYFVFASDGYLYKLEGLFQGYMLTPIADTRMYERIKSHVRYLCRNDATALEILSTFENRAINFDEL